jgi:hypothetical protein
MPRVLTARSHFLAKSKTRLAPLTALHIARHNQFRAIRRLNFAVFTLEISHLGG